MLKLRLQQLIIVVKFFDQERIKTTLFEDVDISEMYAEPCTWDVYEDRVNAIIRHDDTHYFGNPLLDDDDTTRLHHDGI